MDIRHLEYFMEVARQKSFSKAAEVLHTSQPTISKAVKDLEDHFQTPLFYRNTKHVELTDGGKSILEQVGQLIASFHDIGHRLQDLATLQTGSINIGLPPITGVTAFSQILGQFTQSYPKIRIQLYEYGSKKVEPALREELIDIGIIFVNTMTDADLEWLLFPKDPLQVVLHPSHPLAAHSVIEFTQLAEERFLLYSTDFTLHDMILNRCHQAGFQPDIALETSQLELMRQMVSANLGLALLPSKVCANITGTPVVIRPLADESLSLQLALGWKKKRYLSHAARELIAFFRNHTNHEREQ